MASTDARPVPRKNVAFRYYFAVRKNDGTLITTWAGQDSEVDKDGAGFNDCTNEATEIGTSGYGYIDLTSTEMNADAVGLKIAVTNTDALPIVVTFFPEEVGDYRANVEQFGGTNGTFSGGRPEVKLGDISHGGASASLTLDSFLVNDSFGVTGNFSIGGELNVTGAVGMTNVGNSILGVGIVSISSNGLNQIFNHVATSNTTNSTLGAIVNDLEDGGRTDLIVDATLADTNELQTDWANGGRLDVILDSRASQVSADTIYDDMPTAAENGAAAAVAVWSDTLGGYSSGQAGGALVIHITDLAVLAADWLNNGRLNNILDARASQASVDTIDGIVDAILLDTGTDGVVIASSHNLYHADINFAVDEANSRDEYTVTWFKNGVRQTSVSGGQIQVVKRADGADLIASGTGMTQIASTGSWKYDATTTARITAGEAVVVIVTATIDAGTRTFSRVVSRDSEAAP